MNLSSCKGCYHKDICGIKETSFRDENALMTEIELFEAHCVGCCCGDCFECNKDNGCDNYEEEDWLG